MIFFSILILIVAIAIPSIYKQLSPILLTRISAIVFIYAGVLSFNAFYIQSIGSGIGIYSGLFHVTSMSQFIDTFIFTIASLILVAWPIINKSKINVISSESLNTNNTKILLEQNKEETKTEINYATEYSLIVLFSSLGASLLVSSADLISMYLSIELQSFGVYILATLYRYSESATSAGLKYFLLGGLSSCIILLGSGIIYTFTGLTNFESIYSLISVSDSSTITQGLILGLVLIFVGFLFKIAAAPLHNWAPDVYDDSPTIVTIWLTIMPKISILLFLLELQTNMSASWILEINSINNVTILNLFDLSNITNNESTIYVIKNLLLISSLLSLIIGTVVGLAQSKIKRLFAYSTISHIGFILLALAINTEQSIESLLFYIIQYSITNLNSFLIIIALGYIINISLNSNNKETSNLNNNNKVSIGGAKDIRFINELSGQFFANPLLSLSLSICLFSMAGVPPLIGFFSKQFVLYSAIESGYYFMSIVAILVSVISASYYLKIVRVLHSDSVNEFSENSENKQIQARLGEEKVESVLTNTHSFLISTLTLTILLFVLKPSIILNSTQLLSLSLYNF